MNYLVDTCIISDLIKPKPSSNVTKWLRSCREETLFISSLTIGEIQKRISKLPESRKKDELQTWLDEELALRFDKRILGIDAVVAKKWGEIQASSEIAGNKINLADNAGDSFLYDNGTLIKDKGLIELLILASSGYEVKGPDKIIFYPQ